MKQYLRIQIEREEDGRFLLNQNHMIQDIIETFGLKDAKTVKSPMETNYLKEMNSEQNVLPNNEEYRTAMGKLLYLATVSRPDIAAAVGIMSRKVLKPNKKDWNAVKRVVRYLKGTSNIKLKLPTSDRCTLTGYVDADWAGDSTDRKSTSGYLFFLSSRPTSCTSIKQSIVTLSSTEAEYVAAEHVSQEVLWLKRLLTDLGQPQLEPTKLNEDLQGCLVLRMLITKLLKPSSYLPNK
ncbi:uncharacterized protein ACNLHF_013926 [Anomaloglossus baeobatrachus]|uniref:uncharacterized protein LOC142297189 n=1 Tax=Anomaloglossus baeobatrachus TaxID=238106 RepID=UPI003F509FB0